MGCDKPNECTFSSDFYTGANNHLNKLLGRRERAMKKIFAGCFLALVFVFASTNSSLAIDMGLVTGGPGGTYYQFGLNLKKLVAAQGINLRVYNSKGSIENIYAVYKRPRTQMGIVQADVLAFVSRVQTNPALRRIAKKTRLVFPLYNEEVHILGRSDIEDFDGLSGRRVAVGREGSGTYLTARLLFEISEVTPREMVYTDTEEALAELKAGNIDAMFYVAGYPVKLFTENVTEEDRLQLIPIMNKSIVEFYPRTVIPGNTYSWQDTSLNTVAVKAVLISFNFRRNNCDYVGQFARILADNMDWLKRNGHPKWKAVDLNFPLKGWEQYDCVKKYLVRRTEATRKRPTEINPVLQAIKDMLGE
jgi:TRAP transporter TAXI family solute receptor